MFSKLAVSRNESLSDINTQFYVMMLISLEAFIGQSGLRGRCSRKRTKVVYKQVSHAIIFSPRQDLIYPASRGYIFAVGAGERKVATFRTPANTAKM